MTTPSRITLSDRVTEEMNGLYYAVNSSWVAERLWNEVFTPIDKARLPHELRDDLSKVRRAMSVPEIWVRARGGTISRAIVEILYELDEIGPQRRARLLRDLGEKGEDSEANIEIAKEQCKLVIVDTPRSVFWEGQEIPIKWDRYSALWEYLLAASKATMRGEAVDALELGREYARKLIDRKSKLKTMLLEVESTFAERFETQAHRLALLCGEIRIFERNMVEEFCEVQPSRRR